MRIQSLEQIIEQRFESFLEPRLEHWFRRYLESPSGEAIISTILADVMVSWMRPGSGEGHNYLETIVLDLVSRLKDNPGFRERLLATMSRKSAD
ncbi:MAG: hypothetical protein M1294_15225 [Firmicutes bacterium]|jgi:hypothetical protein|uniref:Uncharacterized protein n=1 Tax=Sulfobacillus benefaciens TaxID=453960 RepID=A0A2T2X316_9FIRM|nr:hypothetical protein [Bacillota bacterium]MCL5014544.1 hypothetical protein [Bacillota bacterium]PSR28869.1 MAG: hypothetical protein C7B43_09305 [Sulfobacillus benefaciens]HBQ96679.1 hypothetical protein [Sulfobacillus sp.]